MVIFHLSFFLAPYLHWLYWWQSRSVALPPLRPGRATGGLNHYHLSSVQATDNPVSVFIAQLEGVFPDKFP
ncbi:MAG: hypothetical protein J7L99_02745, partial [Planctomycetes bacterium]|nr:hypothetical protein [Planctomycetota bacterium]